MNGNPWTKVQTLQSKGDQSFQASCFLQLGQPQAGEGTSPPWTGDSLEGKGPQALTLGDGPLVK